VLEVKLDDKMLKILIRIGYFGGEDEKSPE